MKSLFKKISVILLVVISIFLILNNFIDKSKDFKIQERYNILKFVVDAKIIVNSNKENICTFFEHIDSIEHVFAAVYDENLNCLTNRHPDLYPAKTIMFDPLEHEHVVKHMQEHESGELECNFKVTEKGKDQLLFTLVYFTKVHFEDSYVTCVISTPYVHENVKMGGDYLRVFLLSLVLIVTIVGIILTFSLVKQ